jgi:hypothetical protein
MEVTKNMIEFHIKMLAESQGYPVEVKTLEQKDAYRQWFYDSTGIELERDQMIRNHDKQLYASLMLHLWYRAEQRKHYSIVESAKMCSTSKTKH